MNQTEHVRSISEPITGRKLFFRIVFTSAAIIALLLLYLWNKSPTKKYIFINETSDHRFDESIRMSILAATDRTKIQNAVLITDDPAITSNLEASAAQQFKALQVGSVTKGRGILYLYAPRSKQLKIEIGYALEGKLPDATIHGLELAAKSFIFSDRYQDFWAELINTVNIELFEQEHMRHKDLDGSYDFSKLSYLSGGAGVYSKSYDSSPEELKRQFKTTETLDPRFQPSALASDTLIRYLESLHQGIGGTQLSLLSQESQKFRNLTPQTTYQLFRNWKMYKRSGVEKLIETDTFAFAFFKPAAPVLPIILVKQKGLWLVHEPLSWSLFQRFENSMQVFSKFPMLSQNNELNDYLAEHFSNPLYPIPQPLQLDSILPRDPNHIDGSFLNGYDLLKVRGLVEAKQLEALSDLDLWIAIDTYLNLGEVSKFLDSYKVAALRFPAVVPVQSNYQFYNQNIRFHDLEWVLLR